MNRQSLVAVALGAFLALQVAACTSATGADSGTASDAAPCGSGCTPGLVCFLSACCQPLTCDDVGRRCGVIDDRCGGSISCGCPAGLTCGGSPEVCIGCLPHVCAPGECGTNMDGCGGWDCGPCPTGQACNGNRCVDAGCVPNTCDSMPMMCGVLNDGCGNLLVCECPAGETCMRPPGISLGACMPIATDPGTCAPGLLRCDTACVDPMTDVMNCGFCGNVCTFPGASAACVGNMCIPVCPSGQMFCGDGCVPAGSC